MRELGVVNVGDLKPMEYPITFFLDMAWEPKRFNENNLFQQMCIRDRYIPTLKLVDGRNINTEVSTLYNDSQGGMWVGTVSYTHLADTSNY